MKGVDDPANEVVTDLSAKRKSVVRKKSGASRVQEYKQYEFDAVPKAGGSDEWSLDKLQKDTHKQQSITLILVSKQGFSINSVLKH